MSVVCSDQYPGLNRQINILLCAVNVHLYACDKYLKSENHLKNYGDQGGCYPLRLKVSGSKQMLLFVCLFVFFAYNTLQDLHNCSDDTKPKSIIVLLVIQNIS